MKSGLLVICLVLLPLTAQDRSDGEKLTVGGGLKGLQPMPRVQVKAESILENSGIIHLKGTVEINLGTHTLLADEAEYNQDTGEIQAHGDVRLKPSLVLNQGGVRQFGIK